MKNNKLVLGVIALVVVVGVIVSVASMSKKSTVSSAVSGTSTNMVVIKNYMFTPASISVKVGTKVTWMNTDPVNHTVTADMNSTDAPSSMDIAQGKSYSFTFAKAGTYAYHCFPHPYMHGTVVVTQ